MARPTLEKAKQQAQDLKTGMDYEAWLKKWGLSKQGGWAKTSRLKKIGLLPPDFTTRKVDKAQMPQRAQRHIRHKGTLGTKAQLPQSVTMVRWRIPTPLFKKIKIAAISESKNINKFVEDLLNKALSH